MKPNFTWMAVLASLLLAVAVPVAAQQEESAASAEDAELEAAYEVALEAAEQEQKAAMAAVERAIQGGEGALGAGITDTSDQEAEAFRRFLQERVIDRLEEEGVAHRMPRDENWELLEFDVALWASISGDILTLAKEVEATAQQLTDAKAAQRRVVPGSGLETELCAIFDRRRKAQMAEYHQ